ncbi:MAG: hypothetical protein AB2A00_21295 [Myxococcota bacterium]
MLPVRRLHHPLLLLLLLAASPVRAAGKPILAVLPLDAAAGVDRAQAQLFTEPLVQELRDSRAFTRVVTPQELAALMPPEQQAQLLRCAQDECAVVDLDLAGALGASHLLVGNVGRLDDVWLLNVKLLELSTSLVVGSVSERVTGPASALLDAIRPAVRKLLQQGGFAVAPKRDGGPLKRTDIQGGALGVLGLGAAISSTLAAGAAVLWVVAVLRFPLFVALLPPLSAQASDPEFYANRYGGAVLLAGASGILVLLAVASLAVGGSVAVLGRFR